MMDLSKKGLMVIRYSCKSVKGFSGYVVVPKVE